MRQQVYIQQHFRRGNARWLRAKFFYSIQDLARRNEALGGGGVLLRAVDVTAAHYQTRFTPLESALTRSATSRSK
jgi:hypothetical protein